MNLFKLHITPNEPLRLEPSVFGPGRPVYASFWRKQGDLLKVFREDRELTPEDGADRLGLTVEELRSLERGGYSFSLADAQARLRRGAAS